MSIQNRACFASPAILSVLDIAPAAPTASDMLENPRGPLFPTHHFIKLCIIPSRPHRCDAAFSVPRHAVILEANRSTRSENHSIWAFHRGRSL